MRLLSRVAMAAVLACVSAVSQAADKDTKFINLYTARHYEADKAIYAAFTKKTGIEVRRIIAEGDQLFTRLKAEGRKSPADVLLAVDATTLARASRQGLFQPAGSKYLDGVIPEQFRAADGSWYAFSYRPRVLAYNRKEGMPIGVDGYADLASDNLKGMVCTRSSTSGYSMSLLAWLVSTLGEDRTMAWTKGLVHNLARKPQGNDTAQLKAVASGECRVALVNSYYYGKLLLSGLPADKEIADKVALFFPKETFVNISGAGIARDAPHREEAVKFLEFLASHEAQGYFASLNAENPVVTGVAMPDSLRDLTAFQPAPLDMDKIAASAPAALRIADQAGWE